jgi:hypothetical protein
VLVANNLPEFGTDLVAALTTLNVNDLAHCKEKRKRLYMIHIPVTIFVLMSQIPSHSQSSPRVAAFCTLALVRALGLRYDFSRSSSHCHHTSRADGIQRPIADVDMCTSVNQR